MLERVIALVSPRWAYHRAAHRQAWDAMQSQPAARYDAAGRDRSFAGWVTTGNSANAEIGTQIQLIRNRARDLGRNNPYIARAYQVIASKIVGNGIRPRLPASVPERTRQRTMRRFEDWAREIDLYGKQRLAVRTMVESGMAIINRIPRDDAPPDLRVLEPDYIDADREGVNPDTGNVIVMGVEADSQHRPVAYWLFDEHPGNNDVLRGFSGVSRRVPARNLAVLYDQQRPEQFHGVPWAAPIAAIAKHLDDINDVRLKRAKIQACFAAFVTRAETDATLGQSSIDESRRRREQIAPGIIEYLSPGEDVSLAVPPRGEGDDVWQKHLLHGIATGLGLTYAQLTGDLSDANYSSMRGGVLDQWPILDQWQNLIVTPKLMRPLWDWFDEMDATLNRRSQILDVEFQYPERMFVDPQKDGEALDAALLAGRKSWTEVIEARGMDPEKFVEQLVRERERLADLNLPHIPQPAAPAEE